MSANFKDIRFPVRISFGAQGGAEFQTSIVIRASGAEVRNQNWSGSRLRYDVAHAARRERDWRDLQAFFLVVAGRAYSWRFKDWTDYQCLPGAGSFIATTVGSPNGVQMVKAYSFGSQTYYRVITKPVNGTITTDAAALDYATGRALTGTTWSGEFDVHARFETDAMVSETIDRHPETGELVVGWRQIPIVEVR